MRDRRGTSWIAAILALLAGIVVVVGALLEWVNGPSSVVAFQGGSVEGSPEGLETTYGIIALLGGIVVTVVGLVWLIRRVRSRLASVLILVGGAASAAAAGFYFITLESRYIDFAVDQAASPELPAAKIRDLLSRAFNANIYDISAGTGLYVVLVAGTVAALIGFVTLVRRAKGRSVQPSN